MIGFIGGTGHQGKAIALRLSIAGEDVIIGSRHPEKAERAASLIKGKIADLPISFGSNLEAAKRSDIVFFALPYQAMKASVESLKPYLVDKIVVDIINPLESAKTRKGISVSEELQAMIPRSKVVSAFKNVSSELLWDQSRRIDVDSIVCSDSEDAKEKIIALSSEIGVESIDGGNLENALASELLTLILLKLNRETKGQAGIKFVLHAKERLDI